MHTTRNPVSILVNPKAAMEEREAMINNIPNTVRLLLGLVVFALNLFKEIINKASRQIIPNGINVITTSMLSNPSCAKTNFGRSNTTNVSNKARIYIGLVPDFR